MNQIFVAMLDVKCFLLQQQMLTTSAAEMIAKTGSSLLLQTPILLAAFICLIVALIKFRRFRLVSVLTILGSLLLLLASFVSPLVAVWLPFFLAPQPQQTMPDGTAVQPPLDVLQTNLFYVKLAVSVVFAAALLLYLAAIFAGRGKAPNKFKQPSDIDIPTISIK